MAMLVIIGVASYMKLGRNEDPTFTIKAMTVTDTVAGRDTRGHAAADHRAHRAQAAGDA